MLTELINYEGKPGAECVAVAAFKQMHGELEWVAVIVLKLTFFHNVIDTTGNDAGKDLRVEIFLLRFWKELPNFFYANPECWLINNEKKDESKP